MTSAYAASGVDVAAGERAVELMRDHVRAARRPEVLGGLGGFAGLFDASALKGFDHPVLASSTDGVGTKVAIAQALDRHDTIGYDLVGMLVDDLVVVGAEPWFVTDYIACGRVVPEKVAAIVAGVAAACAEAGAALIGGETAEHPGLMELWEYDLAGATTGVVERDRLLGPERVRDQDRILALAASGLHANGYSLVRQVCLRQAGWRLERHVPELGQTLGEALLTPTRVYAPAVLEVMAAVEVHAGAHITGGGLAANLARVVPDGLRVVVDRSTWTPPPIFALVQALGAVSQPDIEASLNQGVGLALILPEASLPDAQALLTAWGIACWDCGQVEPVAAGAARAKLVGRHPR
ncbi:MAG: phosphoribosylformylglycinamidine cyclo-ligase [Propionibacteriaceae bacterium]|jgi:phosphoribosylformylglycinamidine cyclo-ligase|nr:phosphoribosylformylglycinamidine cyclo-ligase [Propionibacteriaceae bacterium]